MVEAFPYFVDPSMSETAQRIVVETIKWRFENETNPRKENATRELKAISLAAYQGCIDEGVKR